MSPAARDYIRSTVGTLGACAALLGAAIVGLLFGLADLAEAQSDPSVVTSAATADALSGTPTLCSAGQAPRGIDAAGDASGCQAIGGPNGRGDLYLDDQGGGTNDWTASGTAFEKMTAFATAGVVEGIVSASAANDELTISSADVCDVWVTVGFSGTGNRTIECYVYAGADGAEARTHIGLPRFLGAGGDVGAIGTAIGILSLSANDRIELWCKTDNATTTLDFWTLILGADC